MLTLSCVMTGVLDPEAIFFVGKHGFTYEAWGRTLIAVYEFFAAIVFLKIFVGIMCSQYDNARKDYGEMWIDWDVVKNLRRQVTRSRLLSKFRSSKSTIMRHRSAKFLRNMWEDNDFELDFGEDDEPPKNPAAVRRWSLLVHKKQQAEESMEGGEGGLYDDVDWEQKGGEAFKSDLVSNISE
jgi:hypothetical protein